MQPVREKTVIVKGEFVTAGLVGVLLIAIFGGGIFLFHNISPTNQDAIPQLSGQSVLSAAATLAPQPIPTKVPTGPQAPISTPKATKSPSLSPSPTASPSASATPSPSPSPDPPPTVSISEPTNDASVSGQLTIKSTASDNGDIKSVSLYVDETYKDSKISTPYEFSWDSKSVSNDKHILKVEAEDNSGKKGSTSVSVNVHN